MEIAIIKDGVISIGHYKDLFPNTSFTANGPSDEWLVQQGAKKLTRFKSYNSLTEKLVSCAPYDDGEFVSVVMIENLTAEEIASAKDSAMANIRSQRNRLLSETDWTQIPDCTTANKTAWATYRQALRDFPETIEDARVSVEWPHNPDWQPSI